MNVTTSAEFFSRLANVDWSNNRFVQIILSEDDQVRNQSLDEICRQESFEKLVEHTVALDLFWRKTDNLYHRVRSLFFLSAIHRYHLPVHFGDQSHGRIPYHSHQHLLGRRFVEAIDSLIGVQMSEGLSDAVSSGLAKSYHELAFQTLADQVRTSVRTVRGNQWMFRTGHTEDHPLRVRKELLARGQERSCFPILKETTAVRMDFSHSGWSDIFFLGMDFPPTGARVINASVNLGVMGRDDQPRPPIECYLRIIDKPVIRLVSVDLKASTEISAISEVFDFAADYLGLLKAAIIAAGIVPPGMEGCGQAIEALTRRLIGPGLGIEVVSKVNDIPKGSRLAVSTNLLGSLISLCMRATGQVSMLQGALQESDRRIIAARAILGEWIGGSGGGWQDSGGVWPGIKLIQGALATEGDPEFGVSRGRLLPKHNVFTEEEVSQATRQKLQNSLVLVHGGMAQNVGPILEMVTEKYLLRCASEWQARKEAITILDNIYSSLKAGDIKAVGRLTHQNFFGPLQKIIPWCTNLFTNLLVEKCQTKYGDDFWGFWMLGGMAGGGMGFIFDPEIKPAAKIWLQKELVATKSSIEQRLPFAMDPVVYEFELNDRGTWGEMLDQAAGLPDEYYALMVPSWLKQPMNSLSPLCRQELETLGANFRQKGHSTTFQKLLEGILPCTAANQDQTESLPVVLKRIGFDREQHDRFGPTSSQVDMGWPRIGSRRRPKSQTFRQVTMTTFGKAVKNNMLNLAPRQFVTDKSPS